MYLWSSYPMLLQDQQKSNVNKESIPKGSNGTTTDDKEDFLQQIRARVSTSCPRQSRSLLISFKITNTLPHQCALTFLCPVIQPQTNCYCNARCSCTSSSCERQSHCNSRESKCDSPGFHINTLFYDCLLVGPYSVARPDLQSFLM